MTQEPKLIPKLGLPWSGLEPRRWQVEALDAVLTKMHSGIRFPLVQAATGAGKSRFLAELAAICHGSVLVTTPSQQLVTQLAATIEERCPGEVGMAFQHAWDLQGKRIVVTCNASISKLLDERADWACWICDEAHRMEADNLRKAQERIRCSVGCGLTATPFRADKRGMENWNELVYAYPSARAVEDGVLVPWRAVRWDGTGKPTTDELVERWVAAAEGPGIVSAVNIADAQTFAARLGPIAAAIHEQLPKKERQRRIDMLRDGHLKCLVHVCLLTEGVDLPFLRWLAMRRPVGSTVRLVQEVGRVLRAHPGKTEAVLYDPYDLLGRLGLTHASSLEDACAAAQAQEAAPAWVIPELSQIAELCQLPPPVAVEVLTGWVSDVLGALRAYQLARPPDFAAGPWRAKPASEKQRALLSKRAWASRFFPDKSHRVSVKVLLDRPEITQGCAGDLLDIFSAFSAASEDSRRAKTHWRCPVQIPPIVVPEYVA